MNTFYFARTMENSLKEAEERVVDALKAEGFGILTTIDVKATLKKKLGADFRPYKILGACNPQMAHQALQAEDKIGVMLPCNVILHELGDGRTEVAAVNPEASMAAVRNETLSGVAGQVGARLRRVVESL